jgi:hypothetical protein
MTIEAMKQALEALETPKPLDDYPPILNAYAKTINNAITSLRQAIAVLDKQEPCGWQYYQDGKWHNGMEINNHRANTEAAGIPVRDVYTYPQPKREPLRDKDIAFIAINSQQGISPHDDALRFARAIEAAHGIKD